MGVAGCGGTLEFTGDDAPGADAGPDQLAREAFETDVQPTYEAKCAACHDTGTLMAPIFGQLPDRYGSILAYTNPMGQKLMDCGGPAASRLVSYAQAGSTHAGTNWDSATDLPILNMFVDTWVMVTPECGGATAKAATGPITLVPDQENTVDLSVLGPGLEGATLTFTPTSVGGGIYFEQLLLHAGLNGLRVVHPTFEGCTGTPPAETADPADTFRMLDVTVPAQGTAALGAGTLSLTSVPITAPIAIRFDTITPEAGPQGNPIDLGGACQ